MPRPRKAIRPVEKNISLPEDLVARVDLELYSEVEGKVPFGAWQRYIEALVRADLARRDSANGCADITQARMEAEETLKRKLQEQEAAKPRTILRECQECGESMPAERQAHGFRLCFYCQSLREARQLRYGG